jgi:hypothetical protein
MVIPKLLQPFIRGLLCTIAQSPSLTDALVRSPDDYQLPDYPCVSIQFDTDNDEPSGEACIPAEWGTTMCSASSTPIPVEVPFNSSGHWYPPSAQLLDACINDRSQLPRWIGATSTTIYTLAYSDGCNIPRVVIAHHPQPTNPEAVVGPSSIMWGDPFSSLPIASGFSSHRLNEIHSRVTIPAAIGVEVADTLRLIARNRRSGTVVLEDCRPQYSTEPKSSEFVDTELSYTKFQIAASEGIRQTLNWDIPPVLAPPDDHLLICKRAFDWQQLVQRGNKCDVWSSILFDVKTEQYFILLMQMTNHYRRYSDDMINWSSKEEPRWSWT